MTPSELANYVADNMPTTQPEIDEFMARLNTRVIALPDITRQYILNGMESILENIPCKRHPS